MDSFGVGRRGAGREETRSANRRWWDDEAVPYYAEHGDFLGDSDLVWGPEGLTESELRLLEPLAGRDVLEIGAGAAQGGRYVQGQGARVVATDLSAGMLRQAALIDRDASRPVPLAQCDAMALPFADASFDVVFTAYGAVPFVADSAAVMSQAARVLRPGGRLVFSTTHPIRWAFPDVPGVAGLVADRPYFDRTPYVEQDDTGRATYVEHHRTLGDRVREIAAAGLVLVDLVEPEWPARNTAEWGGWSPTRGRIIPGTAIFVAQKQPSRAGADL
ncbi:class I SAM-dependent methyltransferase [Flexivirga sp. ID2601S]|uniref:Class I SAM-dependent methyltransferase n=2 Tax=Flexivirga aerilata TaxID=1656889 RepID=A0A849AWX8_9MICO|nr:class I SAM-dependent methyltransferase [Flexivirga aerilata]